jgi:phosphatidylethanolamine-binding protein (PEBP) family uncharacterized protein
MKIIVAAFAAIFLYASIAYAEEMEMKNLDVYLGFSQVPIDHTCEGKNVSPWIEVQGLNATSMAVIVEDQDAPSGVFTHWIIWQEFLTVPQSQSPFRQSKASMASAKSGIWDRARHRENCTDTSFASSGWTRCLNCSLAPHGRVWRGP